jgi:hypothetical protein
MPLLAPVTIAVSGGMSLAEVIGTTIDELKRQSTSWDR